MTISSKIYYNTTLSNFQSDTRPVMNQYQCSSGFELSLFFYQSTSASRFQARPLKAKELCQRLYLLALRPLSVLCITLTSNADHFIHLLWYRPSPQYPARWTINNSGSIVVSLIPTPESDENTDVSTPTSTTALLLDKRSEIWNKCDQYMKMSTADSNVITDN